MLSLLEEQYQAARDQRREHDNAWPRGEYEHHCVEHGIGPKRCERCTLHYKPSDGDAYWITGVYR